MKIRSPVYTLRLVAGLGVSLLLAAYSFTVGLVTRKGRRFVAAVCDYWGVPLFPKHNVGKLPAVPADTFVKNGGFSVVEPREEFGNVSLAELAVINAIVASEKPSTIFEIGTFNGRTTINMAANSPAGARIFTLDLPPEAHKTARYAVSGDPIGERLRNAGAHTALLAKITQLYGDSKTFDFSPYRGAMDLVFVDGAHDYRYVTGDSETALGLLRGGVGTILWHDYENGIEATKAIDDFSRRHPELGMKHVAGTRLVVARVPASSPAPAARTA